MYSRFTRWVQTCLKRSYKDLTSYIIIKANVGHQFYHTILRFCFSNLQPHYFLMLLTTHNALVEDWRDASPFHLYIKQYSMHWIICIWMKHCHKEKCLFIYCFSCFISMQWLKCCALTDALEALLHLIRKQIMFYKWLDNVETTLKSSV